MKCRNCGADLNNGRCEYCGAIFTENMRMFTSKPTLDMTEFEKILRQTIITPAENTIEVTCIGDTERKFIKGV